MFLHSFEVTIETGESSCLHNGVINLLMALWAPIPSRCQPTIHTRTTIAATTVESVSEIDWIRISSPKIQIPEEIPQDEDFNIFCPTTDLKNLFGIGVITQVVNVLDDLNDRSQNSWNLKNQWKQKIKMIFVKPGCTYRWKTTHWERLYHQDEQHWGRPSLDKDLPNMINKAKQTKQTPTWTRWRISDIALEMLGALCILFSPWPVLYKRYGDCEFNMSLSARIQSLNMFPFEKNELES